MISKIFQTQIPQRIIKNVNKKFMSTSQQQLQKVVIFPGHGIGPEISEAMVEIFSIMKVPIEWEYHQIHGKAVTATGDLISQETMNALRTHKFGIKGPLETPIGKGYKSLNVTLRKRLNLYANLRPCKSIKGVNTPYSNVDVVTIRQNTEGEYSGLEHQVVPGVVENLQIISEKACLNIAKYAFQYARANKRKRIQAVHKAGVMKLGDGLFIQICQSVSNNYPDIEYSEIEIDTMCLQLAQSPQQIDVMVLPNLYGDIASDLCAGLIGGLGLTGSGNIGDNIALYEAVHGTAPDIAGKNLANPTALLLSSVMMLKAMNLNKYGETLENSIYQTIQEGQFTTRDLGGKSSTSEYTKALIGNLRF